MSNGAIDNLMRVQFGAECVGYIEDEDHAEQGSIRMYEAKTKTGLPAQRILVETGPDGKATVYTFHKNLN